MIKTNVFFFCTALANNMVLAHFISSCYISLKEAKNKFNTFLK